MSVLATVSRSIAFNPSYPAPGGMSSQSSGGTGSALIDTGWLGFPAASVNTAFTIAFAYATLQQIFMVSDKGMTLKFNSSGSPVPTIVLQPGSPFEWNSSDGYFANPFSANVTIVYVSCTPASRLWIVVLPQ